LRGLRVYFDDRKNSRIIIMKQWNEVFKKHGKVFTNPHEDMKKIGRIFKERKVKKILDLGCGTGRHTVYLAKCGFDIYGMDISEEGVRIAREWLKKEGLKANFKIGSIYKKLPYKDNFFDAVISTNTIHHQGIEKVRGTIQEVERILKPKGLIFITVRKRKFRKFYPNFTIIEKYGKQKSRYQVVGARTYVPIEGGEKGLLHYLFNKELIKKEFKNFKLDIWVDTDRRHYCLLGEYKK